MNSMQISYWEKDQWFAPADVLIVGGGIVGLHAAIRLKEEAPSLRVSVVERHPIAMGASTRNAGFACFGSMSEILADKEEHGEERILELIRMRVAGLKKLRNRLGDDTISYRHTGAYEIFLQENRESWERCRDGLTQMNNHIRTITGVSDSFSVVDEKISNFGFKGVKHLIQNLEEGQLHPGRMIAALQTEATRLGVILLHGYRVAQLHETGGKMTCELDSGATISAGHVILAVNAFGGEFFPDLDLQPARNQVLLVHGTKPGKVRGNFHYQEGYVYFRDVHGGVLIGGGRHIAPEEETTSDFGATDTIREYLLTLLSQHILPGQDYQIVDHWSGILGVGDSKRPIVSHRGDHLTIALRLGGMGVAIGSLVGEQAADLYLGKSVQGI